MKTVDALIAARDFFVAHPDQWTRASLHNVKNGKHCFCALGGISLVTGCMRPNGDGADYRVAVSCTAGPVSAQLTKDPYDTYIKIEELPQRILKEFESRGIHLAAARSAVKYANAATEKLYPKKFSGPGSIMVVNDTIGYDAVIKVLELAIKNAKRRHITGDRKKAVQAVAQ